VALPDQQLHDAARGHDAASLRRPHRPRRGPWRRLSAGAAGLLGHSYQRGSRRLRPPP
jgi:hypothetical protein